MKSLRGGERSFEVNCSGRQNTVFNRTRLVPRFTFPRYDTTF